MSDTYTLSYKNFRSLEDVTLEVAPLTVVYGPNGSGKSSLIYGLLTLRNFLTNPNQNMPSLFSYPSISLGGLHEVVHRHSNEESVALSIGISNPLELSTIFNLALSQSGGAAGLFFDQPSVPMAPRAAIWPTSLDLEIAIPYNAGQQIDNSFRIDAQRTLQEIPRGADPDEISGRIFWNGITLAARLNGNSPKYSDFVSRLNERGNLPLEISKQTGFVPLRRGFSKPLHNLVSITPELTNEDEVASLLASPTERFVQYEISRYVEKIAERRIQTQGQIGTSMFWIDSVPIGRGTPAVIVNEGFGINQLVYMLTICLYSRYKIVAIEEPEIHLHPSMVRELAIALAEIAVEKDRRLIVSTHSETFVVALLSQIAAGKINAEDVSFVHAEKPNGSTVLEQQKANRNGQIEGGLRAFMASEAKDLVDFLGLSGE